MGDPKGPLAITGTPEQCMEAVQKHIDLGYTMFVMEVLRPRHQGTGADFLGRGDAGISRLIPS